MPGAWVYDTIPHYRLNSHKIITYLAKQWPGYDFELEKTSQNYRFLIPNKLTAAQRKELLDLRAATH